jgi:hypothetical protein
VERFSEIVFALIMVLTFTCALGVAEAGRDDVRAMWVGAIGCNLAWGIIDAVFYLLASLAERGRNGVLLAKIHALPPAAARVVLAAELPAKVAEALGDDALERLAESMKRMPLPDRRVRLEASDWRGACGVFLLVFATTLPVVVPFLLIPDSRLALRVSNAVAIALLFAAGRMLAVYAGLRPNVTGSVMVAVGGVLVALAIALGG